MFASPTDPLALWTRRRRVAAAAGLATVAFVAVLAAMPLLGRGTGADGARDSVRFAVSAADRFIDGPADDVPPSSSVAQPDSPRFAMDLQAFSIDLWRTPPTATEPEPVRPDPVRRLPPPAITLVALLDVDSDAPRVAVTIPDSPRVRLLSVGDTIADATVTSIDGSGIDVEHRGEPFRLELPRRARSWPAALERMVKQ